MYSCISINNTERKEIGVPILKRTDEMIQEFNLDYERHFKISSKINLEREKDFKEFLKKQEEHEFYLKHLIKILSIYFKENNFNSDTYYYEYKYPKKRNKKRKKRTKSLILPKNKFIYYYLFKNSSFYKYHKPWIYPLGDRDKTKFIYKRKKTDIYHNKKKGILKIGKAEMKLYVDIFGVIPVNYMKEEKDNKKNKDRVKSAYHILRNSYYNTNSFDNKTHLLLKKGMKIKEKYFGAFDKMKKFVYNKRNNIINLKTKSTIKRINNKYTKKNKSSNNIFFNKSNSLNNNNFSTYNQKSIINNTNSRYKNLKNYYVKNKTMYKSGKNSNYNISSINSISSFNKVKANQKRLSNNSNIYFPDSKNSNYNNQINSNNKNITQDYLYLFKNEYSKTMKKSEILNKDISFLNKVFSLTKNNYNKTKKILEDNTIKKISMLSMIKNDMLAQRKKQLDKYKYIKENMSGNLKVNFLSFVRTPQSKLSFVREFTRQREHIRKYKDIDFSEKSDEEDEIEGKTFFELDKKKKNLINQKRKIQYKFKVNMK